MDATATMLQQEAGSMFSQYLADYYRSRVNIKTICTKEGCAKTTFARWLHRNGLTPRQDYFKAIDTGIAELDQILKQRYSSIVNRCNGKSTDRYGHYSGKDYPAIYEWAEFCNSEKDHLRVLWATYLAHGRDGKFAISIDRLDEAEGYTVGNMQFVTHGFNSWKRSIAPLAVSNGDETGYFFSKEEASRFYGLRPQAIGEVVNQSKRAIEQFRAAPATISEVLAYRGVRSLEEYYDRMPER